MEKIKLNYWEETSYMIAVCNDLDCLNNLKLKISNIKGFKLNNIQLPDNKNIGIVEGIFNNKQYKIGFYPCDFSISENYIELTHVFNDIEYKEAIESKHGVTVIMDYVNDPIESYYLQLKFCLALVPELKYVFDESAEKVLNPKWVKVITESNVLPSSNNLFNIQAVYDDNEVWFHTHGLNRIGITELEILDSNKDLCQSHYRLLSSYASYIIEEKSNGNTIRPTDVSYIGLLSDKTKIYLTYIPWNKAIDEYKDIKVGNNDDRKESHNGWTSVIFTFKNNKDLDNKVISKLSVINNKINVNTMLRVSEKETNRMSLLARENFDVLKKYLNKKDCYIDLKIKICDDKSDEHIWFNMISINKDSFEAQLLQEPLLVKGINKGDIIEFNKNDITDWVIRIDDKNITPDLVYLIK